MFTSTVNAAVRVVRSLFKSAETRPQNNAGPLENPSFPLNSPEAIELFSGGGRTKAGIAVNPGTAIQHSPFWRALNILSQDVGRMPIDLIRERDGEPIEHPTRYLLNVEPSALISAYNFKRTLQFHAAFLGNGYAGINRRRGEAAELLILNPYDTFPLKVDGKLYFITKINDQRIPLNSEDVFHLHGLSFDGLIGYSVIDIMAQALSLPMAAQEFGSKFFGQGALVSGYLHTPSHLSPTARDNAIADFKKMNQGMANAHDVGVLFDGVKFVPTSFSPDEAQFLGTRMFEITTISNITGVPPHKLGDKSRAAYNTLEQENQSYLNEGLDPWLIGWESEARRKLLSRSERERYMYRFNRRELTRNDAAGRSAMYTSGRQWGYFSANDVLRMEGLPGIGPQGDIYLVPANMMDASKVGQEPPAPPATEPPPGPAPEPEPKVKNLSPAVVSSNREAIAGRVERQVAIHIRQIVDRAKNPSGFGDWREKFLTEHREKMVDAVSPAAKVWYAIAEKQAHLAAVCNAVDFYMKGVADDLSRAEESPANAFPAEVARVAETWNGRGLALVDTLMQR